MDERFEARSLVMGLFQATGTAKIPAVTDWILDKLNIQVQPPLFFFFFFFFNSKPNIRETDAKQKQNQKERGAKRKLTRTMVLLMLAL